MIACRSCGAQNPLEARFCNQCGTRIEAPSAKPAKTPQSYTPPHLVERVLKGRAAMQGERKRVTVLFADIKGSTQLAEAAGAEAWHDILDRFFAILASAVHRYEGTVNQYTGDGIMALFGAPLAHEDHAQRACHAALEMQAQVRQFADGLRLARQLNLSMRVGLNTGEVIVGRIGDDLRMDYTAQGLTVNLAARMEHICEPGRVYLSRYTAALVEGYFRLRELGEMTVAGVEQPVEVFELEGEGALRSRLERGLARGASAFIGRDAEMQALLCLLERARGGEGQVAAVVGNAGIGKSRLCHEFARACEAQGVPVHRAAGAPYTQALPMQPARALLRSRLGLAWQVPVETVRRKVQDSFGELQGGELGYALDFLGAAEPGELETEQAAGLRDPMMRKLAHYLPAAGMPQVLLIEDLHFVDERSEAFIAQLAQQVAATSTLLLLNYRSDYVSDWLIPQLDEQLALSALQPPELEKLASDWLGTHESLGDLAQLIRARAGGNPYFVEEAVQALAAEGHLEGRRGDYRLARRIVQWPIADTVHALIAARIDRLPERQKTLLQQAAVIGPEFPPSLLAQLVQEPQTLDLELAELEDAGFVHQRGGEHGLEYAFCQPLMQEVAYGAQLESQRALVHARLAQALEAGVPQDGRPRPAAQRIAHHWAAAAQWLRAGAWNLQAARWAASQEMPLALQQYRLALAHLERADDSDADVHRLRIAARAGLMRMAQFTAVPEDEIERAYAEARQMARDCGDIACSAELLISWGNEQMHRGHAVEAARLMAEAVQLCLQHGLPQLVERFRLAVLLSHSTAGRAADGIALVNAAAGDGWLTRPVDEDNYMSRGFRALYLAWSGQLAESARELRGAIAYAEREDRAASWMYANLVDLAWFSGDVGRVLEYAQSAMERARAYGSDYFRALGLRAMGQARLVLGSPREALPWLLEARPLFARGAFAHAFEGNLLATLAEAYFDAGELEQAAALTAEAIAGTQRSGSPIWELRAWAVRLALPEPWLSDADAERGHQRAATLIADTKAEGLRPWLTLARARRRPGDADAARWQAQAAAEFAAIGASAHAARLGGKTG